MSFTTELRKVFRAQMQSVLASDALASPQQTPKWTEWLFKMLREKVYCMSHLEGLKIVFVKAYTKSVWLMSWVKSLAIRYPFSQLLTFDHCLCIQWHS